jgi:hypothetical protein
MANSNFLCNFGEATCTPSPTITRNEQHLVLEDYLIFWLEAQLKADCTSGSNFNSLINSDSRVTFQKNCLQCEALDTPVLQNRAGIAIYPNPFSSQLNILNSDKKAFNLRIYDSAARILFTIKQTVEQDYLDTTLLTSGIYFYEIIMEDGSTLTGKIIKN